jgi:hypothetical protein
MSAVLTAPFETADMARWIEALDRFESVLNRQSEAIETGMIEESADDLVFRPPTGLPELPAPLRERATALMTQNVQLLARARELAVNIEPTRYVRQPRVERRASSVTFDRRA